LGERRLAVCLVSRVQEVQLLLQGDRNAGFMPMIWLL
jgi:hypothetical protein